MDADLLSIQKIQQGEEAGLQELMARHREALFRFVYRYVKNEADAGALTEETFFRVYQKAGSFQPKAKVSTWMFSIAGNLCRDFIRRNRKRRGDLSLNAPVPGAENLEQAHAFAADGPNPGETATSNEALRSVERAIHALPHKLKFPFIFCVLEDHSYDACAEILGTNRKTVETRIYRARKRLRAELTAWFHDL